MFPVTLFILLYGSCKEKDIVLFFYSTKCLDIQENDIQNLSIFPNNLFIYQSSLIFPVTLFILLYDSCEEEDIVLFSYATKCLDIQENDIQNLSIIPNNSSQMF